MRDEGRTIAVGKVLRYKPTKIATLAVPTNQPAATAGASVSAEATVAGQTIAASASASGEVKKTEELVFDMETGETVSKEEYARRN